MCGRFALTDPMNRIEALFGVVELEGGLAPRWNIAPTQPILTIAAGYRRAPGSNLPERRSVLVRWGLIPTWVKDTGAFPLLFNARSETATEKNAFRAAMRHRRILVPASGFYEWRRHGDKRVQAYWIRPRHGGPIAFAGLMETYLDAHGNELDTGAILTTAANDALSPIHERMPVVIGEEHFTRWLDCVSNEPRDVRDLLRAADDDFFEAVPVSDRVNKVANDDAALQEPADPPAQEAPLPAGGQLDLF